MNLCVLHPSYAQSASPMAPHDPRATPEIWGPQHRWTHVDVHRATSVRQIRALVREPFDVFVNLCDGAWDEDRPGIEVVLELERANVAFTGAGSSFFEPSREDMKRVCAAVGVRSPAHALLHRVEEVDAVRAALRFPMIVKHPSSYSSIGMGPDARCVDIDGLVAQVRKNLDAFGAALVEEYIPGREFTALVAEPTPGTTRPRTWAPVEYRFPPGETFKHFSLKWERHDTLTVAPVEDEALVRRIIEDATAFFEGIGGSGYGRCDLRLSPDGDLHMLEINPNGAVFYAPGQYGSADEILARSPGGHPAFLEHLLETAVARKRREAPLTRVSHSPVHGDELVAARDFAAGEVVQRGEERAAHLVTRTHVARHWDARRKAWFAAYAWPLTDEVWAMWSPRPEDWQPINHACDPNAWLDGLDLVARRPIARGAPITMDYATFMVATMDDFACACGAPECRGIVRGTDHLRPELGARYAGHFSDYVATRRRMAGLRA